MATNRTRRPTGAVAVIFFMVAARHVPAGAEESQVGRATNLSGLPLPALARCEASPPPVLPPRWHAVGLMMPFENGQLDIGDFVYDAALPAMRATVYGLQSGTVDILITRGETYQLAGPYRAPTGCTALGRRFDPPSDRWVSAKAQCVGHAPLMATDTEWWKTPAEDSGATWSWLKTGSRLPWRTMTSSPSPNPAVIGEYAMTYFPTFESVSRTSLSRLRQFCRVHASRNQDTRVDARSVRALMAAGGNQAGDAERESRIEALVPGLSRQACAEQTPPRWPGYFGMTAIMIPVPFDSGPFPSEILYDQDGANAMLTRLHDPKDPAAAIDALLTARGGYDVRPARAGTLTCRREYPGIIKPDWLAGETCACKGVIKGGPLASGRPDPIEIRACTIGSSRAFWAWSTTASQPLVFLSTAPDRSGLVLADYYHRTTKPMIASGGLDLPAACSEADRLDHLPPPDRARLTNMFAASCSNCHQVAGGR